MERDRRGRVIAAQLTGRVFGRWTVISRSQIRQSYGEYRWNCVCSCGTKRTVLTSQLTKGTSRSCGCLRRWDYHGLSKTSVYTICDSAQQRCQNPNNQGFARYGGRGIQFKFRTPGEAAQWIMDHLGDRPSPEHTLDRENNNGHYEPGNLRWATVAEQNKNRSIRKISEFSTEELLEELRRRSSL